MVNMPEDVHEKLHSVTNEVENAIDKDLHRRSPLAQWMLCPRPYKATPFD